MADITRGPGKAIRRIDAKRLSAKRCCRFPSAPLSGSQSKAEFQIRLTSFNQHTLRLLKSERDGDKPIEKLFLIFNGLNELDHFDFYYNLAGVTRREWKRSLFRSLPDRSISRSSHALPAGRQVRGKAAAAIHLRPQRSVSPIPSIHGRDAMAAQRPRAVQSLSHDFRYRASGRGPGREQQPLQSRDSQRSHSRCVEEDLYVFGEKGIGNQRNGCPSVGRRASKTGPMATEHDDLGRAGEKQAAGSTGSASATRDRLQPRRLSCSERVFHLALCDRQLHYALFRRCSH